MDDAVNRHHPVPAPGRGALVLLASALLLAPLDVRPAQAAWPGSGRALCTEPHDQVGPQAAPDGAGGAIVAWHDTRSMRVNVFARRVLASGEVDPAWPGNGRALLTDSTALATAVGGQGTPILVPDGAGGAIVAWTDGRSGTGLVYAQRVLAAGVVDPAWPANGRALTTPAGAQSSATIVADGTGGAIMTWMQRRSPDDIDIVAQHVLATGIVDPAWPATGVAVCTAPSFQAFPDIAPDGAGGAIVTWFDLRPATSGIDVYAQHVLGAGIVDPAWPVNGRVLCTAGGDQFDPRIVSDGAHGALVAWTDARDGFGHVYAQRVLGTGAIAAGWPANGLAVCTAPVDQTRPLVASDGAGGAIVTWDDARNGQNYTPYAQRILASGTVDPAWPANGRALSLSAGTARGASIVTDDGGGAIVAWVEDGIVLVNHVESTGALDAAYPVNGRFVRLDSSFQQDPDLVGTGAGDAILAWAFGVSDADHDIYASLVEIGGAVGAGPGPGTDAISFAPPRPNPASATATLRFALSRAADLSLTIHDPAGRRVRTLAAGAGSAGEHAIAWDLRDDAGNPAPPGVYFARLAADGRVLTRKLVRVR